MEEIDRSAVIAYINTNIVSVRAGRKCIDGRYLPNQASGMIARPGGDGGYVMALMAVNHMKQLGLTPEQCFNAVYKVVSHYKGFCFHTDQGNNSQYGLIGCGHLAKAATKYFARAYDLQSSEMQRLITYAKNVGEIEKKVHMVTLSGEHKEQGVLIIHSKEKTIATYNPTAQQMYFVYDATRDSEFLRLLVREMQIPGLTFGAMQHEAELQLQATLHTLAKGLPLYTVSFIDNKPKVAFLETII